MSLFESASLCITPNGTKASKLYAIKPTSGAGDMTVVRNTTATRVNSAGLIESVASNVPRLDYSNGSFPSILVEPQRTNVALRSQEFDNLTWTMFNGSVTANQTTAPDGTNTADKITMGGSGSAILRQTISGVSNGTIVTFSLYIKQGSGVTAFLDISDTKNTVDITPTANWVRYTYSVAFNTTNNFIDIELRGTSGTAFCYIWGAQLEEGSYATSYIPTTSASVTRNADVISKTGISSLIGQTEGTLFLDFVFKTPPLDICGPIGISSADNTNRIGFWNNYTFNSIAIFLRANGINLFNISVSSLVDGTRYKLAVSYKSGDIRVYLNGTLTNTFTNTFTFSNDISVLYNASYESTSNVHQRTNQITLWKTALTNTQLSELTTI